MNIKQGVNLGKNTSFQVGGNAENYALAKNTEEFIESLRCTLQDTKLWILGYGSNSLISDSGLPGMVIRVNDGNIKIEDDEITADAGAWWDDVVTKAIDNNLWGIELLSEIPGSVGAGLFINITAYGQSISKNVKWIKVWDRKAEDIKILEAKDLDWSYKSSIFQKPENRGLIILQACFKLSKTPTQEVTYQKVLDVADDLNLDLDTLDGRRNAIIECRRRAGSLWQPDDEKSAHTAGSFFRNPIVSKVQADKIIAYDESGKTRQEIQKMNKVHGGDELRVSAAHVMLAAGFKRGQSWGKVKLNDNNLLKIEALNGATAQDIYDVALHIQKMCVDKLGVKLEPEVAILGEFKN